MALVTPVEVVLGRNEPEARAGGTPPPGHRCRFSDKDRTVLVEDRHRLGRLEERRMCIECRRVSDWRKA